MNPFSGFAILAAISFLVPWPAGGSASVYASSYTLAQWSYKCLSIQYSTIRNIYADITICVFSCIYISIPECIYEEEREEDEVEEEEENEDELEKEE